MKETPRSWTKWETSSEVHRASLGVGGPMGMLVSPASTAQEGFLGHSDPRNSEQRPRGHQDLQGAEAPLHWAALPSAPGHVWKQRATPCGHREQTPNFRLSQSTGSPGGRLTPSKGTLPISQDLPQRTSPQAHTDERSLGLALPSGSEQHWTKNAHRVFDRH